MNQFYIIERGEYLPPVEIFDGQTFIALGLGIVGGTVSMHMSAEVAETVANRLLAIVERQKQGEPA